MSATPISHSTRSLDNYSLELHDLNSEETILGLGFSSNNENFIKLIKSNSYNDGFNSLSVGGF